jgi:hypothetical protein
MAGIVAALSLSLANAAPNDDGAEPVPETKAINWMWAPPLAGSLAAAPVIAPQPDGTIYLNASAAVVLSWGGIDTRGIQFLKTENDSFKRWNGLAERPYWRVSVKDAGSYRMIVNRALEPKGWAVFSLIAYGAGRTAAMTGQVPPTSGWDDYQPWEMGQVHLDAGEQTIELRPLEWKEAHHVLNLADVRLVPVGDATENAMKPIFQKMGVAPATPKKDEKSEEKPSSFTDYNQFLALDRATEQALSEKNLKSVQTGKFLDAVRDAIKAQGSALSESDNVAIAAWMKRLSGDYPKVTATQPEGGKTLFAPGPLATPKSSLGKNAPVVINLPPASDATARMARFNQRNSEAQLEALCTELNAALKPNTPGLEAFAAAYQAKHYAEALDAFRTFFFDTLVHPEAHGASIYNFSIEGFVPRGTSYFLTAPEAAVIDANLHGAAIVQGDDKTWLRASVGEPGAVPWAPATFVLPADANYSMSTNASHFWKTPEGETARHTLDFYRALNQFPPWDQDRASALFPALITSYVATGNKDHLDRFSAYLDDWCLNSKQDIDNSSVDIRVATELESAELREFLGALRIMHDQRPAISSDFSAPTLARCLLHVIAEEIPYTIRARRAEQANWGIMGIGDMLNSARLLNEFKAMDYFQREGWRLAQSNFIQHRTLDGEDFESWDEGHSHVDLELRDGTFDKAAFSDEMDDLNKQLLLDNMRVIERSGVSHLSPAGDYWAPWTDDFNPAKVTLRTKTLNRDDLAEIIHEPEVAARVDAVLYPETSTPALSSPSECKPYSGMYYLRDHWGADSDFLCLQNTPARSQDQASFLRHGSELNDSSRTAYGVYRDNRGLLDATPIVVDGNPPNVFVGQTRTGGKTDFNGQAGRNVLPGRFFTSSRFDLAEAVQDSPYQIIDANVKNPGDWYGLSVPSSYHHTSGESSPGPLPAAISDVTARRQIFHLRGEDIFLVGDRVENKGASEREFSQFFTLGISVPADNPADRIRLLNSAKINLYAIDPSAKTLRTSTPGRDNVSVYLAGPALTFGGSYMHPGFETQPDGSDAGGPASKPISVRWKGNGNQALVSLVYIRPRADKVEDRDGNGLKSFMETNGERGIAGCSAVTASGAKVWYQTGPERTNQLTAGPASAQAESLLAMDRHGEISGIVLGASSLHLRGKTYQGPSDSFEYVLSADGGFVTTPIHEAIDTTQILPEAATFTDSINVSFTIPTQDTSDIEFHYTLDGSEPTLQSTLYQNPFPLRATTLVKVRPFRKGLTKTPWDSPGVDAGKTIAAVFRKEASLPADSATALQPGLKFDYFEGDWPRLFTYTGVDGVLTPKSTGTAPALLDDQQLQKIRQTDRAYAVRYDGYIKIPVTGVYEFFAPKGLYETTEDAGYDLRVFVDDKEWYPSPTLHEENKWSVPLDAGLHRFKVAYVEYRWKQFRDEYWMSWQPSEMGKGTPVLNVSGPQLEKQPLPAAWLYHL